MKLKARYGWTGLFLLLIYGIIFSIDPALAAPVQVFTSVPPHAFLAERIGGEYVQVHSVIDGGQNPHTFEPGPRQIMEMSRARILFTAGLDFEHRLSNKIKGINKQLVIVDLTAGIQLHSGHAGHPGSERHNELDPHLWLSPPLLEMQAINLTNGLVKVLPEHRDELLKNLTLLTAELHHLTKSLRKALEPFSGRSFYVFHPAFGYFAEAFGLHQQAVEINNGTPAPRQLAALIKNARADGVRVIFTQPQFDQRSAAAVAAAIDGVVVSLEPMAKDIFENYRLITRKLEAAFSQ